MDKSGGSLLPDNTISSYLLAYILNIWEHKHEIIVDQNVDRLSRSASSLFLLGCTYATHQALAYTNTDPLHSDFDLSSSKRSVRSP